MLEALLPDVLTTNEPTRIAFGAPDYILSGLKDNIPIGYIEAKDLGADLNAKAYQAQFDRYKAALPNLILTNYLQFQIFKEGVLVTELSIGAIAGGKVISQPENFELLIAQLKNFALQTGQTIQSASVLAAMMATKAKMLSSTINAALTADEAQHANSTLRVDLNTIREFLIRDLKIGEFADIYAQTIAYGMFAARLHDPSVNTFSRRVVAELIPKTNPLLRLLFNHVAGINLDKRIVWIVDALADIFKTTDLKTLLKDFGKNTQQNDPIIHFYETFLAEYDPKLRKIRGVWYTPQPVVNFMVRAIDELLQSEFNLPAGLADKSKVTIKLKLSDTDKRYKA